MIYPWANSGKTYGDFENILLFAIIMRWTIKLNQECWSKGISLPECLWAFGLSRSEYCLEQADRFEAAFFCHRKLVAAHIEVRIEGWLGRKSYGGPVDRSEWEAPYCSPNGVGIDQVSSISECAFDVGSGEGIGRGMCVHRLVGLESDRGDVVLDGKSTQLSAEVRAKDAKGR